MIGKKETNFKGGAFDAFFNCAYFFVLDDGSCYEKTHSLSNFTSKLQTDCSICGHCLIGLDFCYNVSRELLN